MHSYGDEGVDWDGICNAANYIGQNLIRWGRVSVFTYKEKFGTVRVYCGGLGWYQFHSITHPGHAFNRYPKWLSKLDDKIGTKIVPFLFNWIVIPYHKWLYKKLYQDMVKKHPHLREEILCVADYRELLEGIK